MLNKKMIMIIGGAALVLIIAVVIILLQTCSKNEEPLQEDTSLVNQRRDNILKLANSYMQAGEFNRALDLLDGLLIENPDDEDARALHSIILGMDRSGGTEALLEAQRRFLEEQQRQNQALAENLRNNPASAAEADALTARRLAAIEEERRFAAERRAAAEEERKHNEERRLEEERRLAAEKQRAEEERLRLLASVNASLQSASDASKGISSGAERVEVNIGDFELD